MRFYSADSLSPFGKGGLNSYCYCLGDPVNRTDPTGHKPSGRQAPTGRPRSPKPPSLSEAKIVELQGQLAKARYDLIEEIFILSNLDDTDVMKLDTAYVNVYVTWDLISDMTATLDQRGRATPVTGLYLAALKMFEERTGQKLPVIEMNDRLQQAQDLQARDNQRIENNQSRNASGIMSWIRRLIR
jgi:hypothetical protein